MIYDGCMSSDVHLFIHVWWHTKDNVPWLDRQIEARLVPYIGGVVRDGGDALLQGGAAENHIHLLLKIGPRTSLETLIGRIKGASSFWLGKNWTHLQGHVWQHGYGAKSLSESAVPTVIEYIKNQREHHGLV